jgi:hypothetical protein
MLLNYLAYNALHSLSISMVEKTTCNPEQSAAASDLKLSSVALGHQHSRRCCPFNLYATDLSSDLGRRVFAYHARALHM